MSNLSNAIPGFRRPPLAPLADAALIEAFRGRAVANISDNMERLSAAVGLRPLHQGGIMAGTALTVRTRPGDNLAIHQALELMQPGYVLVVDGGGDVSRALVGEIMKAIAQSRGCVGFVIDGVIRDADAFARDSFPCFARGAIHAGPYKSGPGEINVPVSIGGMVVNPGDILVGDADGVVAFPAAAGAALLAATLKQEEKEAAILRSIAEGTYAGAYAKGGA
ncbi:RraA family protein [Roseicella frigidaeris]|uniref:Putative 4-hydroxy-4-methyl-2-oxoglutarate aldolase n=1 Tax=Roseicella frigidaeris TaxID=2230885 RepID=A0A327MB55_9PROT|nr:RraA family protein [Roseicella frigidaeris]RAI59582.1 RraA family protein [Roseicella frigidaeris]